MKRKLVHFLLSLLVAFGLWLYVITTVNPGYEASFYNIPVKLINESVLADRGMMLDIDAVPTVSLKLSGNRSDLIRLNKENIVITADLSGIHEAGTQSINYTISYPGDVSAGSIEVLSKLPGTITVTTVATATKLVPVVADIRGDVPEGYLTDKETAQFNVQTIKIFGPADVVNKITQAVVSVDLTGRTESVSGNFAYTLCDAQGNPVETNDITADIPLVNVSLKIQRYKEISLILNVIYGSGTNSVNTTIKLDPMTLYVSGSEQALEAIGDQHLLGELNMTEVLQEIMQDETQSDLSQTWTKTFEINLPDGVENLSNEQTVTVSISFKGLTARKIAVNNIKTINVPNGFEAMVIKRNLTVIVCGPAEKIDKLTQADMTATVDLSSVTGATDDMFKADVLIEGSEFSDVHIVKADKVPVKVTVDKENGNTNQW